MDLFLEMCSKETSKERGRMEKKESGWTGDKKEKKTNKGRIKIERRGEDRLEQLMEIGCSTSAFHE